MSETERSARFHPATPVRATEVGGWDAEADVVVIGHGVAGTAAAIEARAAGADVLILERTGGWGGAAALAGGFIYLGGGTPLQQACGFGDTPAAMHDFLAAAMGPGIDAAKIAVYSEQSVAHFNWLVDCGVPFRARRSTVRSSTLTAIRSPAFTRLAAPQRASPPAGTPAAHRSATAVSSAAARAARRRPTRDTNRRAC